MFGKEIPNWDRVPNRYKPSNILMAAWWSGLWHSFFWHFGILNHKVPSSSLSTFIYFGPRVFHFCRLAQIIPAFEAMIKVTNNCVCTFGIIMEFGTALLLDRTQILQNDHIYIYYTILYVESISDHSYN